MKKLFWASGLFVLVFAILFLTGILDIRHTVARAFAEGNRLYENEAYDEAENAYNTGLHKEPENPLLNYNAGQACYRQGVYDQALEYYQKSADSIDRFLNAGNSAYRLAESIEDVNQKRQHYAAALEFYRQGILAFPENVELKYNYEFVLEKLKQFQDENQQDQQNEDQPQENQDGQQNQNDQNQDRQNQDGQQDQNGQNQDRQNQDGQQDQGEQQENPQDSQNGEDSNQNENQQSGDTNPKQEDGQSSEEQQADSRDQTGEPQETGAQPAADGEPDDSDSEQSLSDSEIQWILKMLEQQEADSLKNNQKVKDSGREDEHDW